MRIIRSTLLTFLMAASASAQVRPGVFTTVNTTNTGAASVCAGCAVGSTTAGGGIKATTIAGSGNATVGGTLVVSGVLSATSAALTTPVFTGTITGTYTLAGTPTITAPAISSPVFSGTATGTYALAGTPTITSPTISNPAFSGTATGTYTLAGTPTITAPTISNEVLSGTVTGTYTLGGTPTISAPTITGNASIGGVLTVTGFGTSQFTAGNTGGNLLQINNTSSGSTNYGAMQISGNTTTTELGHTASNFSATGAKPANGGYLQSSGDGGLTLAATDAAGQIKFMVNGTTLAWSMNGGNLAANGGNGLILNATGYLETTWPTSGSSANAVVGDADYVRRSTSSLRYKNVDHYLTLDEARTMLMAMPGSFLYSAKTDEDKRLYLGFAAEQVAVSVPALATYTEKNMQGLPDYVTYDRIATILVPVTQDHEARLIALEKKVFQ